MSKKKWRRGPHITSLDELARQEVVFWLDKPTARGWFGSWQFSFVVRHSGPKGIIFYAMPSRTTTRFSDDDVIRAERRLKTKPNYEGRLDLIRLLNQWDRGTGDVDDVIDEMEEAKAI